MRPLEPEEAALRLSALRLLGERDLGVLLEVARLDGPAAPAATGSIGRTISAPMARLHPAARRLRLGLELRELREEHHSLERADAWFLWGDGGWYCRTVPSRPEPMTRALTAMFERLGRPVFLQGTLAALGFADWRALAITGTREPHARAAEVVRRFGAACARAGIVLVHGGARGIDTAACEGAAEAGGPQLVVLGEGLDVARLEHPLQGLFPRPEVGFLSALHPAQRAKARTLVARNAAIARLSRAVVVGLVLGPEGGAWHTLRHARELGRGAFTFPHEQLFAGGEDADRAELDGARGWDLLRRAGVATLPADWQNGLRRWYDALPAPPPPGPIDTAAQDDLFPA